jgi:hypothetical protein
LWRQVIAAGLLQRTYYLFRTAVTLGFFASIVLWPLVLTAGLWSGALEAVLIGVTSVQVALRMTLHTEAGLGMKMRTFGSGRRARYAPDPELVSHRHE